MEKKSNPGHRKPQVRASIHETHAEVVSVDVRANIYKSGIDNLYPQRIERIERNSPTAKSCRNKVIKYSFGKGISKINKVIVNEDKKTNFLEFHRNWMESLCTHRGVFVNVIWKPSHPLKEDDKGQITINKKVKEYEAFFKVLPYSYCRLGKPDSNDKSAKVAVCDDWENANKDLASIQYIDMFNPDPRVIQQQIEKAKGIKEYKGQVLFFNMDNSVYPLATIDQAYLDADSEYRAALRINNLQRYGVSESNIFLTKPLNTYDKKPEDTGFDPIEAKNAKDYEDTVLEIIKKSKGVEKAGTSTHIEVPEEIELKDFMHIVDITPKVDAEMFTVTTKGNSNNIRRAYDVPPILDDQTDNSIFGNSGELLKQGKIELQENCEDIRLFTEDCYNNKLFPHHKELSKYTDCKIDLLVNLETIAPKTKENDKAPEEEDKNPSTEETIKDPKIRKIDNAG